ncbi:DUF4446 family protein [Clostridium cochlearium]|jgi:hypothetical protein|uniref:DUF4446 family protein n=1 Tax=Clostridium cochlearium TaxID=1494 RepID=A0A240B4R4_CLOCO|nr:DUF4446 family protein [Clostridium cochlearium]MBV1819585.1 DUF4446 family protein [Bacteroidales bacterium MSK.15.36]NSJ90556.1 DUF4446 family protein [Coprococcus sp. MSK.21.13]MBE6065645.1 DUF4446 family protein [Clostridium cochlearium]MBU5270202.1 DUF4446 family protein [Clostridium cochlearium]MCG4571953.1 DUF4446 family protein [Clostridium cochlearium]
MEAIIQNFNDYSIFIILGLMITTIILFFIVIVQSKAINRLEKRYRKFMRGVDNKNLEELISTYLDKVDKASEECQYVKELYKSLEDRLNLCIQKVAIIRYRAFEDVGSDLSFSVALLDHKDSGIIITGIYGRNESTTYAKPIDKGISRYELSEEENHVLKEAMNK